MILFSLSLFRNPIHLAFRSTTYLEETMPLVRIDLVKGVRSPDEIRKLANVVQEVMRKHFHAPERDRYQVSIIRANGIHTVL